ncbi:hypothetical protein [Tabrizicola sp.]|uniref:hypothetical protein n=1 Tax=Tabrizicola sp. TaxID=2005166 RepID=UPI00286A8014|nr:hypothetical protein [Tabrizicola sp.]
MKEAQRGAAWGLFQAVIWAEAKAVDFIRLVPIEALIRRGEAVADRSASRAGPGENGRDRPRNRWAGACSGVVAGLQDAVMAKLLSAAQDQAALQRLVRGTVG